MKRMWTLIAVGLIGASLVLAPMTYAQEGDQGSKASQTTTKKKRTHKRHSSKKKASAGSSTTDESNK